MPAARPRCRSNKHMKLQDLCRIHTGTSTKLTTTCRPPDELGQPLGTSTRNVDHQPLRHIVDEILGVAQFLQLPAKSIAQARLLVDAQTVLLAKAERLAADLLQRRHQLLRRDVGPPFALRVRRALRRQFARQHLRELVDLLGGGGTEYSHGSHGIINAPTGAPKTSRPASAAGVARDLARPRARAGAACVANAAAGL